MRDIRTSLAEAISWHESDGNGYCECGGTPGRATARDWGGHIVDVLLRLPGIVIVELPEPPWEWALGLGDVEDLYARDGLVVVSGIDAISPAYARELAAALLAAANASEA